MRDIDYIYQLVSGIGGNDFFNSLDVQRVYPFYDERKYPGITFRIIPRPRWVEEPYFDTIDIIYNREEEEYDVFFKQTGFTDETRRQRCIVNQEVEYGLNPELIDYVIYTKIGAVPFYKGKLPDRFYIINDNSEEFRTKGMAILHKLDKECVESPASFIPNDYWYYGRIKNGQIEMGYEELTFTSIKGIVKLELQDLLFLTKSVINLNYRAVNTNFFQEYQETD